MLYAYYLITSPSFSGGLGGGRHAPQPCPSPPPHFRGDTWIWHEFIEPQQQQCRWLWHCAAQQLWLL